MNTRRFGWICLIPLFVSATMASSMSGASDTAGLSFSATPGSDIQSAIGSFDAAVERLPTDMVASRAAAIAAAHEFRSAARIDGLGRTQRARLLYNAGASLLLAGEHAQAIALFRSAERLTPGWAWKLREDIVTNLTGARSAVGSHVTERPLTRRASPADPERSLLRHLLVVVPAGAWLVMAGAIAAIGSAMGLVRLALKRGPGHVCCVTITLIGTAMAVAVLGLARTTLDEQPHAVVMIADALPRIMPDEVLSAPALTRCPIGTEVVVVETTEPSDGEAGPVWLAVRRLGDPAAARFWLPASAVEMVE